MTATYTLLIGLACLFPLVFGVIVLAFFLVKDHMGL